MIAQGPGPWYVALLVSERNNGEGGAAAAFFIHTYPLIVEHFIRVELGQPCKLKTMVGPFEYLECAKNVLNEWKKYKGDNLQTLFTKWKKLQESTLNIWGSNNKKVSTTVSAATTTTQGVSVGQIKSMLKK